MQFTSSNLFPQHLFDRFNRLESVWQDIYRLRGSSKALQHQLRDVDSINSVLEDIAKKLQRKRFSVGFLGTSQAGKSTTLNNYIDQRGLLPEGEGRSCTSIRVRLFATTQQEGYRVRFVYLTKEAYQERRDDLACGALKLYDRDSEQKLSNEVVLEKLDLKEIPQDDRHFAILLKKLIDSFNSNRNLLSDSTTPNVVEHSPALTNDMEVRALLKKTATHDGGDELKYSLLDEIQLGVPGLALPSKLELVDLPGLGTARAADSEYTMRAVRELDAAIVAINFGGNLDVPENYVLVRKLREIFDGDARRVWIVGTKLDAVGPDPLLGRNGKDFPRMLAGVLSQHKLHFEQVSFVANTWFNKQEPTSTYIRLNHSIEFNSDNTPILPDTFKEYPDFSKAFASFCKDGGIQALKDVINGTMVDAITEGLSNQIERSLQSVVTQLCDAVSKARQSAELGESGRALARKWRFAIDEVSHSLNQESKLSGDKNPLGKMADRVRSGMKDRLDETLRYARPTETGADLTDRFRDISEEMYQVAIQGFGASSELTKQYFESVFERLRQASKGTAMPTGVADPIEKLKFSLKSGMTENRHSRLMQDILSLKSNSLVDSHGGIPVSLPEFREVMLKKVDQVVRQVQYRFQNFVRIKLQEIANELKALAPPEETSEHIKESVFDQILGELAVLSDNPLKVTHGNAESDTMRPKVDSQPQQIRQPEFSDKPIPNASPSTLEANNSGITTLSGKSVTPTTIAEAVPNSLAATGIKKSASSSTKIPKVLDSVEPLSTDDDKY